MPYSQSALLNYILGDLLIGVENASVFLEEPQVRKAKVEAKRRLIEVYGDLVDTEVTGGGSFSGVADAVHPDSIQEVGQ